jgi:hypothetical protein
VDSGATNDFVSRAFIDKYQLLDQLLPTTRRVRGYDGQAALAAGTFVSELELHCPTAPEGKHRDTARRQFLVAQLHSDDVILGMPWLTEWNPDIDFQLKRIRISHGEEPRELPLVAPPQDPTTTNRIISEVQQLYEEHEDPVSDGSLSELLSRSTRGDSIAELVARNDDRGSQRSPTTKHRPDAAGAAGLESSQLALSRDRLLKEFKDVFPDGLPAGLPPSRGHELHIKLVDGARPPAQVPPRVSQKHAAFEKKWLQDMLAKRLISKSQSQYAAPHFYVEKPETSTTGEYRAVTDFRRLNAITLKNKYPLPRADQLFDKLAHAKYFTKIDLRTGFYQILISEADRHKTAFTTGQGLFEYNVLPMGLCNSPGVFMQLMNDIFREFLGQSVLVFLDDIIVYSNSIEEHEQHVRAALQRLREHRLFAKLSKSALCQTEVEFLGHWVGQRGLRVMDDKIEAVRDWPTPTNIRELRAFLGLAGYYRRFVRNFSGIALPLTELTRTVTHQKLERAWGPKQQLAFVELKRGSASAGPRQWPTANRLPV